MLSKFPLVFALSILPSLAHATADDSLADDAARFECVVGYAPDAPSMNENSWFERIPGEVLVVDEQTEESASRLDVPGGQEYVTFRIAKMSAPSMTGAIERLGYAISADLRAVGSPQPAPAILDGGSVVTSLGRYLSVLVSSGPLKKSLSVSCTRL